jgi:hypothetical protein
MNPFAYVHRPAVLILDFYCPAFRAGRSIEHDIDKRCPCHGAVNHQAEGSDLGLRPFLAKDHGNVGNVAAGARQAYNGVAVVTFAPDEALAQADIGAMYGSGRPIETRTDPAS